MKHKTGYKALVTIVVMLLALSLAPASWADEGEDPQQDDWFRVSFLGMTINEDGTSTWSYRVEELGSGKGFKDLSHWVLGLGDCAEVIQANPAPYEVVKDPRTGIYGIKWEVNEGFESGVFSFTLDGVWPEGYVDVGTKAGRYIGIDSITGPSCEMDEDPPSEEEGYGPYPEEDEDGWYCSE